MTGHFTDQPYPCRSPLLHLAEERKPAQIVTRALFGEFARENRSVH
jgi:hypothetical protein